MGHGLADFHSGEEYWQACGALCHGWNSPGTCVVWTFELSRKHCYLFSDDKAINVVDGVVSGDAECYSSN